MKAKKTGLQMMKEAAERMGMKVFDYYPDPLPARKRGKKASTRKKSAKSTSRTGTTRRARSRR